MAGSERDRIRRAIGPALPPEVAERIKARVMAEVEVARAERTRLLYWRWHFAAERIERGHELPEWDWPRVDD